MVEPIAVTDVFLTLGQLAFTGIEGMRPQPITFGGFDISTGDKLIEERTLQFWPTSLSESISSDWNPVVVPGGGAPILTWSSTQARTWSMELVIGRLAQRPEDSVGLTSAALLLAQPDTLEAEVNAKVEEELGYLRSFLFPRYAPVDGYSTSKSPAACLVDIPNAAMGLGGSSVLWTVMTSLSIDYKLFFPNGRIRSVGVSVELTEISQYPSGVLMPSMDDFYGYVTPASR